MGNRRVRDWVSIQFHADCFQTWEVERLLPMNELASIQLVATTEALDKAIALLLKFHPETLYQDALHAFLLERDKRKLGSPARAIILAR